MFQPLYNHTVITESHCRHSVAVWRADMVSMVCWRSAAAARQAGLSLPQTADFHAPASLGFRQNGLGEKSKYVVVL